MDAVIKKRLNNWAKFMDPASKQSLMYIIYVENGFDRPLPYPENIEKRIDWATAAYERAMERTLWLDDDNIPSVMPYTGTEIVAQAFGSPVSYPNGDMPFALPAIKDVSGLSKLKKPDVFSSNLGELFEIAERIRNRVGRDAIVQLPDIQSPLDSASLIWEKADFLMSLIDDPNAVHELISMVEELLMDFLDAWFKEFGTEYIAHCPYFPMRGGFTFSEDEVGEFSSDMFEEFSLPYINNLSKRYGGCAMHCCAYARHQWNSFRKIEGLRLINICQPAETIEETAAFFGNKVCHIPHIALDERVQPQPIPTWAKAFTGDMHLVLNVKARDGNEARDFATQLKEYSLSRSIN